MTIPLLQETIQQFNTRIMEINLKVILDVSPKAMEVARMFAGPRKEENGRGVDTLAEIVRHIVEEKQAPEEEPKPVEPETADPEETAEEATAAADQPVPVSDEELRQHMDMAISRFAGNGWKESEDKRVLAIKKGCTKAFKAIAAHSGAEKPTMLDNEGRLDFINQLKNIKIVETEGKLPEIEWQPF